MRRRLAVSAVLVAVALAACGADGNGAARVEPLAETTEAPAPAAPAPTAPADELAAAGTVPPTVAPGVTPTTAPAPPASTTATTAPAGAVVPGGSTGTLPPVAAASGQGPLRAVATLTGDLSPKSVVASPSGLFFAQNMMYQHTVAVYDRARQRVATIPDSVDLAALGYPEHPGTFQGSPVEAAFSPDGRHAYVSNYEMYGPGFSTAADDECNAGDWDDSFLYRIDTTTFAIDAAAKVGAVPKYVAATPDGRYVLVSNWCGFDLSVVDTSTFREVTRIPLGRHPRGIAVSPDSRRAYVTVMGAGDVVTIDLGSLQPVARYPVGQSARHAVLSPDGQTLYVSLNLPGQVVKVDASSGQVLARAPAGGGQPRSMVLSRDGQFLYVVNYADARLSKLRTDDLSVVDRAPTNAKPVGITIDPATGEVWVSCYSGSLMVFSDT